MSLSRKDSVAAQVAHLIKLSGKSYKQIAEELGYSAARDQLIAMWAENKAKLPINKVAAFARAVGTDPAHLMETVLSEYSPDMWTALQETIGRAALTPNEKEILDEIRKVTHYSDPKLQTSDQRDALRAFANSLLA